MSAPNLLHETPFPRLAALASAALLAHESGAGRDDADQRFFASYLLGHLSLLGAADGVDGSALPAQMSESLERAFAVDRLSAADKQGILQLWQQVLLQLRP